MLTQLKVEDFLDVLASDAPAPGGGSIAALNGAMAAGLVSMVCRLSRGRKGLEQYADTLAETLEKAQACQALLTSLVDEDTEAFNQVMAAFKMPKASDAEKAARSQAIQKAFGQAVNTPLKTAETCAQVLELARGILGKFNPNTASDLGVSAQCAEAGLNGALMNVAINLPSLKDKDFVQTIEQKQTQIKAQAAAAKAQVDEEVKKAL